MYKTIYRNKCEGLGRGGLCNHPHWDEQSGKPCIGCENCPNVYGRYDTVNERGRIVGGGYHQPSENPDRLPQVEVMEAYPCRHCGAGKICRSPKLGGGGFACVGECDCQAFEPSANTVPAVVQMAVPEKLAVRQHRRLVSVDTAQALSHQYLRVTKVTNAALKEMVVFGAMLAEIDKALTSQRFANKNYGGGASLRSWLEANCPEIEYATAMDYKRTMKNFMAYKQLKEDTPLLEMMNADPYDDEQKEALRRDILDSMTGLTKTQLRKLTDAKVGRPGRPVGSKAAGGAESAARAKTAAVRSAEAEQEMRELIGKLGAFLTRGGKVGMLSAQARDDLHRALVDYAQQLAEQM